MLDLKKLIEIVFHFTRVIMLIILTSIVLEHIGYVYSHPKEITASIVIDFVLSRQILLPMFTFILFYVASYPALIMILKFEFFFNGDKKTNKVTTDFSNTINSDDYIKEENGKYIQGIKYQFVKYFLEVGKESIGYVEMVICFLFTLDTLLLALTIMHPSLFKIIALVLTAVYLIYQISNARYLYALNESKDTLTTLVAEIEQKKPITL